jgi:3-oxoadipate enol-lactonase
VKSLAVNGTEIWYVDRGAGVPLLLVHGFPLDHTLWAGQIDSLAGRTGEFLVGEAYWAAPGQTEVSAPPVRVIAPDLRGFGRSKSQQAKLTMEQFADDLAGLLDGLGVGEPVVLCGLSMGGYVALQFWRKYAARLRGLILCDTRAAADAPAVAAARLTMADQVLREGPGPLVAGMMPRLFSDATRKQQPQTIELLRSTMMATDPRTIAAAARGMAERPDMTAALSQIRCPTLVMVGRDDITSPPAEMHGIAQAIPGAKFIEIADAGHLAPLENPSAVNAAIAAFLATV